MTPKMKKVDPIFFVVTPIFTPEIGNRLRIARMKLLLDQKELAERLGVSQTVISVLELGKQKVTSMPFSVSRMIEVFGRSTHFILLGTNSEKFKDEFISNKYWIVKLKRRRKLALDLS